MEGGGCFLGHRNLCPPADQQQLPVLESRDLYTVQCTLTEVLVCFVHLYTVRKVKVSVRVRQEQPIVQRTKFMFVKKKN